jgi:hypothetical protein
LERAEIKPVERWKAPLKQEASTFYKLDDNLVILKKPIQKRGAGL